MGFVNRNVGREVRSHLLGRFGFVDDEARPGQYRRAVDAQHQLFITDAAWNKGKGGGHTTASLEFQVARRDINELRMELLNPLGIWWPTVKVNKLLFDGDSKLSLLTDYKLDAVAVSDYCDLWVPKFIEEAPRLLYIHEMFEVARPVKPLWRSTHIARMLDTLLEGDWSATSEDEFFFRLTDEMQQRIRAWVAEHPDGIERDVHGEVFETRNSDGEIEVSNAVLFPIEMPTSEQFAMLAASGFNWYPDTQSFRKVAAGEPGSSDLPWREPGWANRS